MPLGRPVLFIDDGGVMNDNSLRAPQWAALLGPFMSERYGGDSAAWSRVNRVAFTNAWECVVTRIDTFSSHTDFHQEYCVLWSEGMFAAVGLDTPPPDECVRLVEESSVYALRQIKSDIPGVAEAVRRLAEAGMTLHTGSGTVSAQLEVTLAGMGVRDCFGERLYGPDLVDWPKSGPEYYRRVFEDARADPRDVLVIDDSEQACSWARAAGARAIRVGSNSPMASLVEVSATVLGT